MNRRGRSVRAPKPIMHRAGLLLIAALPWSWFLLRDTAVILEWVAILLPVLAVGAVFLLLVAALLFRVRALKVLAASTIVFTVVAVVLPWTPARIPAPESGVRLIAANVYGANEQPDAAAKDLLAADADLVVAAELTPPQAPVAEALDGRYPYRVGRQFDEVRVWSRFPLQGGDLPGDIVGANGVEVMVSAPAGPFLLYALHLFRPSRRGLGSQVTVQEQDQLVRRLTDRFAAADLPIVIAGDLNLTDRGAAFRLISRDRRDAMRSGWTGPTSFRPRNRPLLLRIDHLLIPASWCAVDSRRVPLTGSDHRAVAATVGPCP